MSSHAVIAGLTGCPGSCARQRPATIGGSLARPASVRLRFRRISHSPSLTSVSRSVPLLVMDRSMISTLMPSGVRNFMMSPCDLHITGRYQLIIGSVSQLDAILHAQPVALPAPVPGREHRRHDYTGWYLHHPQRPAEDRTDPLQALLGPEHFAAEEPAEPVKKPRWVKTIPEGMHKIGDLAKALHRRPRLIREWIEKGTIPDAPAWIGGNRVWPAAEVNLLAQIAQEEGLIANPHALWRKNSNFIVRAHDEVAELRRQQSHQGPFSSPVDGAS